MSGSEFSIETLSYEQAIAHDARELDMLLNIGRRARL
jgi:deoxyribose-phosphate aldolase